MNEQQQRPRLLRFLDRVEVLGNRLPDPAVLFLLLLIAVWVFSAVLAQFSYSHIDPRTGNPLEIHNLATPGQFTHFLSRMVPTFVGFHPLGVVLLAMLGIGVADYTGFIRTGLKALMNVTSKVIVTPMLLLIAIVSHSAVDAGYVLVIPLGAVIFQAAGRHPLAGIAAAFAGVSGGFSANFVPVGPRPAAAGHHPGGRPDHRSRHRPEPAEQLVLHLGLHAFDRRPRLVPDRPDHRAAPVGHGAGRRPGRGAGTGAPDPGRAQGTSREPCRDGVGASGPVCQRITGRVPLAVSGRPAYGGLRAADAQHRAPDLPDLPFARNRLRLRRENRLRGTGTSSPA